MKPWLTPTTVRWQNLAKILTDLRASLRLPWWLFASPPSELRYNDACRTKNAYAVINWNDKFGFYVIRVGTNELLSSSVISIIISQVLCAACTSLWRETFADVRYDFWLNFARAVFVVAIPNWTIFDIAHVKLSANKYTYICFGLPNANTHPLAEFSDFRQNNWIQCINRLKYSIIIFFCLN